MKNVFSILLSIYLCYRGYTYLSQGENAIFGGFMLIVGVIGLGYRLYAITKSSNTEE